PAGGAGRKQTDCAAQAGPSGGVVLSVKQTFDLCEKRRRAQMVDVFRPRVFRPKFSFNSRFFTAHQFQNLIIFVFVQPETVFGAAIEL
ncbi:MAG TPA: hypothetical protein VIJ24_03390, partial [Verrucomicrobiae bacterium]